MLITQKKTIHGSIIIKPSFKKIGLAQVTTVSITITAPVWWRENHGMRVTFADFIFTISVRQTGHFCVVAIDRERHSRQNTLPQPPQICASWMDDERQTGHTGQSMIRPLFLTTHLNTMNIHQIRDINAIRVWTERSNKFKYLATANLQRKWLTYYWIYLQYLLFS